MQVSNANNVKIYSVTSAARSAIPDWLAKKNIKSLKKDQDWRRRIELIQDFDFPEASLRIKSTRDGNFILATGVYQPQLRVFELAQKSMKFDRHQDCENVNFEILSDDWTKTIMLQSDRTIELHTQFGLHYKTRVPKFGRDLKYHYPSCDLLVGGASNEVWRLNLEAGRFMTSMSTSMPAVNTLDINPAHQLFGFGGEDGRLEFFHPTQHRRIGALDVASAVTKAFGSQDAFPEVSSIKFCPDGLSLAVGTSTGQILIYDLRSATPLTQKDHQYGFPIKSLSLHNSGNIISADTKIIKIWEMQTGKPFTSIEPPADINDVLTYPDSGLIMAANEGVPIQTFYIPQLGPAPKWCAYLDNLTEEMEENPQTTVYDDYKFVTRKDLEQLSLDHLIGTNVLKAYMHGFFVDLRLYEKAKAIANPFQFDEHKRKMVEQKIAKQRESRIRAIKNLPKINRDMAAKLLKTQKSSDDEGDTSDLDSKKTKKRKQIPVEGADSKNPLGDGRFSALFEDEDFQIDRTSHEYMLHHPSERVGGTAHSNKKRRNDNSGSDDDRELAGDGDLSDPHTSDESSDFDSDDSEDDALRFHRHRTSSNARITQPSQSGRLPRQPKMQVLEKRTNTSKSFGERLGTEPVAERTRTRAGNLEVTFTPRTQQGDSSDEEDRGRSTGDGKEGNGRRDANGRGGRGGRGRGAGGRGSGRGRGRGAGGRGAGGRGSGRGRARGRGRGRGGA